MNPPNKKFKLELTLTTHSFKDLIKEIDRFSLDMLIEGEPEKSRYEVISSSGYSATLTRDDTAPNEEEYIKQIIEWHDNCRKSKPNNN